MSRTEQRSYLADDVLDCVAAPQFLPAARVDPQRDVNVRLALLVRVLLGVLLQL